jgi:hypothetical protein
MTEPRVGEPSIEYRAVCAFSPRPGMPSCGQPATLHVCSKSTEYGAVGLETCDVHAPIARAAGEHLGEHPAGLYCGLPGTLWTDAECVLDDSGVRLDIDEESEEKP